MTDCRFNNAAPRAGLRGAAAARLICPSAPELGPTRAPVVAAANQPGRVVRVAGPPQEDLTPGGPDLRWTCAARGG